MDEANPPAPTVSPGGTMRDFGNMLNYHKGPRLKKKRTSHQGSFSPWTKMKVKGGY
jgi:hypothetical protein